MGKRLAERDCVKLFSENNLLELAAMANEIRYIKNPQRTVTYVIDRNINYTNICLSGCKFCAFYCKPEDEGGFLLSDEALHKKVEETISNGGTQVLMQGGLHPGLDINYYEDLFKGIKNKYDIHLHALSPPEVVHIASQSALSIEDTLRRLIDSGLDSIPGGGAEILSDRVRQKLAPNKCSADEWIEVMRRAHKLGMRTTATMMFGHIETFDERVEHLTRIRNLQDETGGFTAFIPWTFQPLNTDLQVSKSTALDYLKTLAISRIYLDNIIHLQVSWVTQGEKIAQVALSYGADDFGSVMMEENVVRAAGVSFRMREKDITRMINDFGHRPRRRDMFYNELGDPLCNQK